MNFVLNSALEDQEVLEEDLAVVPEDLADPEDSAADVAQVDVAAKVDQGADEVDAAVEKPAGVQ